MVWRMLDTTLLFVLLSAGALHSTDQGLHAGEVKERASLEAHKAGVHWVAFSPNSKLLASVGGDRTLKFWDAAAGEHVATLGSHKYATWRVAFGPDNKTVALTDRVFLYICDAIQKKQLGNYDAGQVDCLAFTPQGDGLVLGGVRGIRLFTIGNTKPERELLRARGDGVVTLLYDKDRFLAAEVSLSGKHDDKSIIDVWDVNVRERKAELSVKGHVIRNYAVAFAPKADFLVSGGREHTIRFWDLATKKNTDTFLVQGDVENVAVSPDGKLVAAGYRNVPGDIKGGTVALIDVQAKKIIGHLKGHKWPLSCVAFSPDGQTLASASADGTIKLWDLSKLKKEQKPKEK